MSNGTKEATPSVDPAHAANMATIMETHAAGTELYAIAAAVAALIPAPHAETASERKQ
jgi:hypothetical protein